MSESKHHVHGPHGARGRARRGDHEAQRAMRDSISRRDAVTRLTAIAAGVELSPRRGLNTVPHASSRLKQSVSRWCYNRIPIDTLCEAAKSIGYQSVELLDEADWQTPRKHGLECAMANGFGTIPVGFNRPDNHDKLVA